MSPAEKAEAAVTLARAIHYEVTANEHHALGNDREARVKQAQRDVCVDSLVEMGAHRSLVFNVIAVQTLAVESSAADLLAGR